MVVDGLVEFAITSAKMPGKPDEGFVDPAGVAAIAWDLTRQSRRAWSFGVEARPFGETW